MKKMILALLLTSTSASAGTSEIGSSSVKNLANPKIYDCTVNATGSDGRSISKSFRTDIENPETFKVNDGRGNTIMQGSISEGNDGYVLINTMGDPRFLRLRARYQGFSEQIVAEAFGRGEEVTTIRCQSIANLCLLGPSYARVIDQRILRDDTHAKIGRVTPNLPVLILDDSKLPWTKVRLPDDVEGWVPAEVLRKCE